MIKKESGVMVMKNGKAWGVTYEDGQSTSYGWVNPEDVALDNPKYVTVPSDLTHDHSIHIEELETGEVVPVERVTTTTILGADPPSPPPYKDWAKTQYDKINDFVIQNQLWKGHHKMMSHADIIIELATKQLDKERGV